MRPTVELSQDLVFVGGGHAHALVLRMLAMRPIAGLRITLISPASHTPYSGMLPGLVAGHYSFEQTHIDLARLCQWAGVRFIASEVTALDPQSRKLTLVDRPPVSYDLLSIDIGSQPELDSVPGAREFSVPVKPVADLWRRWRELYGRISSGAGGEGHRIAVVGGGAGSVELAMGIAHKLAGRPVSLQLYCGADEILQGYNARARSATQRALVDMGIVVELERRVARVDRNRLHFADGGEQAFDQLFWCTGASAAPWVASSGLRTDERGFLAVLDTLQSVDDERVFGAGDIATQLRHPRPKAGVYAVRQGPVLAHNLRNLLLGRPLREHRPQRRFLSLVSLGGRRATADRGPFAATGAWVWHWKDRIDREFMARFEDLPDTMQVPADTLPETGPSTQAHCGGCGAKVGAEGLGKVLAELGVDFPEHCRGEDLGNDTSQIPASDTQPIVQSIDVLRQLVADPWLMGRIAANHALSDLYASGARPLSALATVTLPFASGELLQRELKQLLAGALHEFSRVGCRLTGGHSLQGAELNIGFVVNGAPVNPDTPLLSKTGLAAGDHLVLTKPLGTGTLFAAHMQLRADGRDIAGAIDMMLQGNGVAAELALSQGASACTDVTGFGLAGHLLEMLSGDLTAKLQLDQMPLLQGALDCVGSGIFSTMHQSNRSTRPLLCAAEQHDTARLEMLYDPQTSGGLLIGIPADRSGSLCEQLRERGYTRASVIGEVGGRADSESLLFA